MVEAQEKSDFSVDLDFYDENLLAMRLVKMKIQRCFLHTS